jgi:O-antigen/teichoic acid export membrane protein
MPLDGYAGPSLIDADPPPSDAAGSADQQAPDAGGTASELRGKTLAAIRLVAGRNVLIKLVALGGNVVFARLLAPSTIGTVAFGLTLLLLVQLLSDGGLGAGLIRRPEEPAREDLSVLLGYQLILAVALACAVAAVCAPLGHVGAVTALMMLALPLLAFRTPSSIVYERSLNYKPLLTVEVLEEFAYYAWGVTSVLLGAGVWGLASASIAKALVGTVALFIISPVGRLRPSYSWKRLRPMLGFGVKFQAVEIANVAGAQVLNLGIAGIGGFAVLGLWTLAWRIAMIPFLLFSALWRVSYPATAKLLAAGESARGMIERGLRLASVSTGFVLAPATGALSPLIPAVFGSRWAPVADVLPLCFFALQASGPVSVSTAGYLYAVGDTSTVLRAAAATSLIWLVVTLPLLPYCGLTAVGIGWMVSSLLEIPILSIPVHRRTGAAIIRPILGPWAVATLAGGSGWLLSRHVSHGLIAAGIGGAVAALIYASAIFLLRRADVLRIVRLAREPAAAHG